MYRGVGENSQTDRSLGSTRGEIAPPFFLGNRRRFSSSGVEFRRTLLSYCGVRSAPGSKGVPWSSMWCKIDTGKHLSRVSICISYFLPFQQRIFPRVPHKNEKNCCHPVQCGSCFPFQSTHLNGPAIFHYGCSTTETTRLVPVKIVFLFQVTEGLLRVPFFLHYCLPILLSSTVLVASIAVRELWRYLQMGFCVRFRTNTAGGLYCDVSTSISFAYNKLQYDPSSTRKRVCILCTKAF